MRFYEDRNAVQCTAEDRPPVHDRKDGQCKEQGQYLIDLAPAGGDVCHYRAECDDRHEQVGRCKTVFLSCCEEYEKRSRKIRNYRGQLDECDEYRIVIAVRGRDKVLKPAGEFRHQTENVHVSRRIVRILRGIKCFITVFGNAVAPIGEAADIRLVSDDLNGKHNTYDECYGKKPEDEKVTGPVLLGRIDIRVVLFEQRICDVQQQIRYRRQADQYQNMLGREYFRHCILRIGTAQFAARAAAEPISRFYFNTLYRKNEEANINMK